MFKSLVFLSFLICFFGFSQSEKYNVTDLEMNTEYPHFGLMLINDSKIFCTSFLLNNKDRLKRFQGNPILTIFEGDLSNDGSIQDLKNIEIDPDQKIFYITSATLSPKGDQLYLTTIFEGKDISDDNFQIKVGEFENGVGWTNFKTLSFCNPKYSYAHPTISKDGKILYFISNIRGGKETTKGGSDIFKVDILGDNIYSEPKNLGSKVNSYSKEIFPFISADNTLYFASDRPNGFGGYDIYESKTNKDGTFGKAEKLPNPINSNKDDFCFVINTLNKTGYFSSKREGGKGDDDIYYFILN